ncbi:MAG: hypothetical protein Q8Q25_01050 [bacterium]|nr:hypothetical protein [bacterium]
MEFAKPVDVDPAVALSSYGGHGKRRLDWHVKFKELTQCILFILFNLLITLIKFMLAKQVI